MNIQHIFFDLDHTLWDFDKNSELTFQQILKEQNIAIELSNFLEVYVPINSKYWKEYQEEKVTKSDLQYGRLKDTFDALNYKVSDEVIQLISKNYIAYLPNYNHLIDGAVDLLEYLKDKYQLHIITNGFEEVQHLKLEKSNIKKYFNEIITSESVNVKKPNSKIFNFALSKAEASPEVSVMIGDNYEADVLGALQVGMLPIYCNFNAMPSKKGILSVKSLAEIKQYF